MLGVPCQGTQWAPGRAMSPPVPPALFWGVTPTCSALSAGWLWLLRLLLLPQHCPGVGNPGLVSKLEGDRSHQHPGDTASPLDALQSPSPAHLEGAWSPWPWLLLHLVLLLAVRLEEEIFPGMQHCQGGTGCHGTARATAGVSHPRLAPLPLPGLCLASRTPIKANNSTGTSPKRRPSGVEVTDVSDPKPSLASPVQHPISAGEQRSHG